MLVSVYILAPGVTTHNSPVKSPTKTFALQQQSSLPYAIAQSTLALAKLNRPTGATSGETLQQQSTPPTVASLLHIMPELTHFSLSPLILLIKKDFWMCFQTAVMHCF